jgi:enoyl-CoA hydratase/carnithine racemase
VSDLPQLKDSTLEFEGRVATLTFLRDDVRNALTGTALAEDIVAAARWANGCAEVSVLVLTGEGSAFSAGGNVKTMRERAAAAPFELERAYRRGIQELARAMRALEVPAIAAVNGPAVGAGFDLANFCDLRIGSTRAQFGETFANLGLIAGDGGAWYLARLLGHQRAAELTFTGRLVGAEEAKALGILLEVTAPEALLARAHELAQQIAARPPLALRYAKRLLRAASEQGFEAHLEACSAFQAILQKSADHAEALSAFFEKRPGAFRGA